MIQERIPGLGKLALKLGCPSGIRRQSGQTEGQATVQFARRCIRRRFEPGFLEFPVHEPIDRVFPSGYFFHLEWPVRPKFLGFVAALLPIFGKSLRGHHLFAFRVFFLNEGNPFFAWPRSAFVDPVPNPPSLFLGQLVRFLGGHFHVLFHPGGKNIEKTFFSLTGNQDFVLVRFSAEKKRFTRTHVKIALDLLRVVPVARHAFLCKEGFHFEGK